MELFKIESGELSLDFYLNLLIFSESNNNNGAIEILITYFKLFNKHYISSTKKTQTGLKVNLTNFNIYW